MSDKKASQVKLSAVFYTDGSAVPNPGNGGWGIYGYTYDENKEVKIAAKQTKNIMTNRGFLHINNIKEDDTIKPCRKIDELKAFGTADKPLVSNTEMELKALEKAFGYAIKQHQVTPYQDVTIVSDSKNSIESITTWYDRWEKNGWLNSKGVEVKMKPQIQTVYKLKEELAGLVNLSIRWVKGHSGNTGNDAVDKLANYGTTMHKYGKSYEEFKVISKEDKVEMNTSDFFTKNRWYFIGGKERIPTPKLDDYYVYFTGSYGDKKKDADFGMHTSDGFMSVILLKEPEPIIEKIQDIYSGLCQHDYNFVVCGNLDTALTPASYDDIMNGDIQLICEDPAEKTLSLPSGRVVCTEYNPPHLSYIQMERYERVLDVLKDHLKMQPSDTFYVSTDIKPHLVEYKGEGKKKVAQLKKSIQSANFVKIPIHYSTDKGKTYGDVEVKLTIKTDLPDKLHLNKLIKLYDEELSIQIIARRSSDEMISYYTVIETKDMKGIWVNLDSAHIRVK